MRNPRPHDYNPKARSTIQAEELDISDITPLKAKSDLNHQTILNPVRPVRGVRNDHSEPSPPPAKREIKRHAFEIYRDQLHRLQDLKLDKMKQGENASMSEMVRTAIDDYLKRQ